MPHTHDNKSNVALFKISIVPTDGDLKPTVNYGPWPVVYLDVEELL